MTVLQLVPLSNNANVAAEIFIEAAIDALATLLMERSISADQVTVILPVEVEIMVSPTPPQLRGIYRNV